MKVCDRERRTRIPRVRILFMLYLNEFFDMNNLHVAKIATASTVTSFLITERSLTTCTKPALRGGQPARLHVLSQIIEYVLVAP